MYEDYKLEKFRQIFVTDDMQFGNKVEKNCAKCRGGGGGGGGEERERESVVNRNNLLCGII